MKPADRINRMPRAATGLLLLALAGIAGANPTAPVVVYGTASPATAGNILSVTNSHNTIINWNSFSIGLNELAKFIQPSAQSAVLNRVAGQNPSVILGALQSNGRVVLINRNGIVFSATGQIDVGGLVASTLALPGADLLAGRLNFANPPTTRAMVGQGAISPGAGNEVYLAGAGARNGDVVTTPDGERVLAAGKTVELVDPGTPDLRVEIVAPKNHALNLERIAAAAGRSGIYAGLMRDGGRVNADRVVSGSAGTLLLKAGGGVAPSSMVAAAP